MWLYVGLHQQQVHHEEMKHSAVQTEIFLLKLNKGLLSKNNNVEITFTFLLVD